MAVFLIYAENSSMLRWVDVQPDHVRRLRLEVRIVRSHVAADSMNLQVRPLPYGRHQRVTDPELLSQFSGRPVCSRIDRLARGPLQDASFHGRSQNGSFPPLLSRIQPGDASFKESPLPPAHVAPVTSQLRLNRGVRLTLGQKQNQPRSACVFGPHCFAPGSPVPLDPTA